MGWYLLCNHSCRSWKRIPKATVRVFLLMCHNYWNMPDNEATKLLYEIHGRMQVLDERASAILKQAEKTNGRVNVLEDKHDVLQNEVMKAKGLFVGGIAILSAVWAVVTFIFK